MADLKDFISEIYELTNNSERFLEEEQRFPERDVLEKVCQVLLHASSMREEGRYSAFRVCFIDPDSVFLDAYIYSHRILFDSPITFSTKELRRLAPAMNPDISCLLLDITKEPVNIIGMIAAYTTWKRIQIKEIEHGNRMPMIPNIMVNSPGELKACLGEAPIVSFQWGEIIHYRTDTFDSTLIAEVLKEGSVISEENRSRFLYRVLKNVLNYGHGGHFYIVPNEYDGLVNTRIKYRLRCSFMFSDDDRLTDGRSTIKKNTDKDLIAYADLISKFTAVDGAVVLTRNFDLIGFGAETLVKTVDSTDPEMCFIDYDNTENKKKKYNDNGMRHRSCYSFCNSLEGAVALIVSHDGFIKACTRHEGRVVVYDSVSLPTA